MARIVIAGGHGQIALLLSELLHDRGDDPVGIIRSAAQTGDLREHGAESLLLDLEQADVEELAEEIDGCDAVVFAAGAGPGSGAARKETVDYGAAVLLRDAALAAGIDRYVMLSAMGTDDPPQDDDDVFAVYLRAKARADREVAASDLDWTIVRPGGLTDDDGTGKVELGRDVGRGEVPREDVAAVLAAVLGDDDTIGRVIEVVSGDTPVDEAIADLEDATTRPPG